MAALDGTSFDVPAGGIFGLLGPNGAGKTTALECILGLRAPDSGEISIGGVDALERPMEVKRLVGAQIQGASLQDKISPSRALGLFASFYEDGASADELLARFGLSEKADAPFDSLSAGQRQRLFLALAFVNNPSLVILDEPTAGLDPGARRDLRNLIAGLRETGVTVLLSTHDLEEAQSLCDTVAVIDGGRVIAVGKPDTLIAGTPSNSTISVTTARPLEESKLRALSGLTACHCKGNAWILKTTDVNATLAELTAQLRSAKNEILDLRIQRPSLEDAFLSLTGRAASPSPKEGAP